MANEREPVDADLCPTCGRVRVAARWADYTVARARLVEQHGLCICPVDAAPVRPERPDEGDRE